MPSWSELAGFGALGLLGALHCAAMCGGFAVTALAGAKGWRSLASALLYVLGKALTYAVLGAAVAGVSTLVIHAGARSWTGGGEHARVMAELQRWLAYLSGGTYVVFALVAFGWLQSPVRTPLGGSARLARWFGWLGASVRTLPKRGRSFLLGVVNGLLPCGLTLAALSLAAGGPAGRGALGMLVFGLATGPVLAAVGLAGGGLFRAVGALRSERRRRGLGLVLACLALWFGLQTAARGRVGENFGCCRGAGVVEVPLR